VFEERKDPRGNTYFWMGGDVMEEDQEPDSDVTAINEGFISLTPIHFDLTNYALVKKYRQIYRDYVDHC
jgi:5'-nucleotidase